MKTHIAHWCACSAVFLASTLAACRRSESTSSTLSDADRAAIRANDSAYVAAWMRDDTAGVLSTLTADPVLIPGGLAPLHGVSAAKGFW